MMVPEDNPAGIDPEGCVGTGCALIADETGFAGICRGIELLAGLLEAGTGVPGGYRAAWAT
jgi:hypothetical protein